MVELIEGLGNLFLATLRAGFFLFIVVIVLLVIAAIALIIRIINSERNRRDRLKRRKEKELLRSVDEGKAGMDTEVLRSQGNEIEDEKARIRAEHIEELRKKTLKRNKKIFITVTIIVYAGIIVAGIVSMVLNRLRYVDIDSAEVGNKVLFGHYMGLKGNGWIVLDKKDDKLLILSEYVICLKKFNEELEDVTWSTCSLRKWMNTEYLTQAFSEKELERIADTSVYTEPCRYYKSSDGEYTIDKVFLLSIEEAEKYFSTDEDRMTTTTKGKKCWWWLRTPCGDAEAGWVYYNGEINPYGMDVDYDTFSVRPAMWIKLKTK